MNIRENKGITLIAVTITVVLLLIILGISITGALRGIDETEEATQISELNMVQHAILERYTKAQLTKETLETLPGTKIEIDEVQSIIDEIYSMTGQNIELKGKEYIILDKTDLENLGITDEEDTFIVNYKTGEVINMSIKATKSGNALYIYSKEMKD